MIWYLLGDYQRKNKYLYICRYIYIYNIYKRYIYIICSYVHTFIYHHVRYRHMRIYENMCSISMFVYWRVLQSTKKSERSYSRKRGDGWPTMAFLLWLTVMSLTNHPQWLTTNGLFGFPKWDMFHENQIAQPSRKVMWLLVYKPHKNIHANYSYIYIYLP